jgi:hypothetical protein
MSRKSCLLIRKECSAGLTCQALRHFRVFVLQTPRRVFELDADDVGAPWALAPSLMFMPYCTIPWPLWINSRMSVRNCEKTSLARPS